MGLREWMSGCWRRRYPRHDQTADIAQIRDLARAASAYEEVPAAPSDGGFHRSGFVDVERSTPGAWSREVPDDGGPHGAGDPGHSAAPWTHQWSPIEGGDLTPWMSAEERQALREADPSTTSSRGGDHIHLEPEAEYLRLAADHEWEPEQLPD